MVVWIIGLSGAGKTTIGHELYLRLRARKPNVVFLDGDAVRAIMGHDLGHTLEDRRENARRIGRLCAHLDTQGVDVVCAILSLFQDLRDWNRDHYREYFEVFVDVPMDVLVSRDDRGIYRAALEGRSRDVVGVDIPFVPPELADIVVRNTFAPGSAGAFADLILEAIDRTFARSQA